MTQPSSLVLADALPTFRATHTSRERYKGLSVEHTTPQDQP